ncbi:hypothetical protein [Streptomyces sp. NPDC057280]|uniref:hypothetical protein n=1 Tax=Streptomyces sp. NPDC057280 TaxID=3346081 RepID=UPI00363C4853
MKPLFLGALLGLLLAFPPLLALVGDLVAVVAQPVVVAVSAGLMARRVRRGVRRWAR